MTTPEYPTWHIIYHGLDRDAIGRWVHRYAIHEDAGRVEILEPNCRFNRKLKLNLAPGIVYSFAGVLEDGQVSYTQKSQRYVGRPEDADEIQAGARAAEVIHQAEKKAKQPWTDSLAPAAAAYRKATGLQKQVVLALAVAAITGRKK